MITKQDWKAAGDWAKVIEGKALPVQVEEQIYYDFLGCVPPIETGKTRAAFINVPLPVQSYFLVGEPYSDVRGVPVYACFARAFDTKYFFLGYCASLNN